MAKMTFTSDNKSRDFSGYPKLRLTEKGEKARISILEEAAEMVYVHAYRKPVVEDGKIVQEKRTGKNGDYEVNKTEFVDQHLCVGDIDIVSQKGIDPNACDSCKNVKERPDMFDAPKRKFGQHVLRYKTKPGTAQVALPFQAELLLWQYTDYRFDMLVGIAEEHEDLRRIDLILGPCEVVSFQKYDVQAGGKCEWVGNDERKALVKELFANNKCDDIATELGKKASPTQIAIAAQEVIGRWAEVGKSTVTVTDVAAEAESADELSSLLDDTDFTNTSTASEVSEPTEAAAEPAAAEPDAAAPAAEKADDGNFAELDDLLAGLD